MKRQIVCLQCGKDKQLKLGDNPYPMEFCKYQIGEALLDFKCDTCNNEIPEGKKCVAFTIYTVKDDPFSVRNWARNGYIFNVHDFDYKIHCHEEKK